MFSKCKYNKTISYDELKLYIDRYKHKYKSLDSYTINIDTNPNDSILSNTTNSDYIRLDDIDNNDDYDIDNIITIPARCKLPSDVSYLFANTNTYEIRNLQLLNTSRVVNMSHMFDNCRMLTSLDLSSFDTSRVINMSYMFNHCESLTSLNISSFDTHNVTNMECMFTYCKSIKRLNLSMFNTLKVRHMSDMFFHCEQMEYIKLSKLFNTSRVISMADMFCTCESLKDVNISSLTSLNVPKGVNLNYIFSNCYSLKHVDLANINIASNECYNMFTDSNNIKTIIDDKVNVFNVFND